MKPAAPLRVALVAGEHSGDHLGAALIRALRRAGSSSLDVPDIAVLGVGGEAMRREGLESLFPMADIAVMGFAPVIARLPLLLRRISETVAAVLAARPDVLVIIDSPDFTHRVARRVRAADPLIPIVNYVSPTVWAWRPGRARHMRDYVDHVLAVLPFEPDAHRRLGGPPCTYVGHPLAARLQDFTPDPIEIAVREAQPPLLLLLPGSRRSEIARLLPIFGETLDLLSRKIAFRAVLPAVSTLDADIRAVVAGWSTPVDVVSTEASKLAAFRTARAALAASGTVTLELALAGTPMIGAYRVGWLEAVIVRRLATAPSVLLPNLILGRNAIPEFLQTDCTPVALSDALIPLLMDSEIRAAQLAALLDVRARLASDGVDQAERAARIVLELAKRT